MAPRQEARMVSLSADYLVVGAGAMGLAFTDEIISTSTDTTIVLVDTRAKPGGHWNDAYDFVTLHQPAAYYGVNSEVLGTGNRDLASKFQILAYFERVLKKLEATGRVKFYPQCRYSGGETFTSVVEEELQYKVAVRRRVVDASYLTTSVPSTHPPKYTIHPGVTLVPINGLAKIKKPWDRYVVIGAGKTGIDAVLHLLHLGINPDLITWVVPNDPWMTNRDFLEIDRLGGSIEKQVKMTCEATDGEDFYRRGVEIGYVMQLDPAVWPTKQKCATVSAAELVQLRTVASVLRHGRVAALHTDRIEFQDGTTVASPLNSLYVDCTSDGLATTTIVPIFQPKKLVLQPISLCQQVMSASAIAALELMPGDDVKKNRILEPIPHPTQPRDMFRGILVNGENDDRMAGEGPGLRWYLRSRLTMQYHLGYLGLAKLILLLWSKKALFTKNLRKFAAEDDPECRNGKK